MKNIFFFFILIFSISNCTPDNESAVVTEALELIPAIYHEDFISFYINEDGDETSLIGTLTDQESRNDRGEVTHVDKLLIIEEQNNTSVSPTFSLLAAGLSNETSLVYYRLIYNLGIGQSLSLFKSKAAANPSSSDEIKFHDTLELNGKEFIDVTEIYNPDGIHFSAFYYSNTEGIVGYKDYFNKIWSLK